MTIEKQPRYDPDLTQAQNLYLSAQDLRNDAYILFSHVDILLTQIPDSG